MNEHPIGLHQRIETSNVHTDTLKWWQRVGIYEIAPVSFQDSNGDGKSDLPSLINRIGYLKWLGGDAVCTPIYRSPMLDLCGKVVGGYGVNRDFSARRCDGTPNSGFTSGEP